jgi:aminopeptidase N
VMDTWTLHTGYPVVTVTRDYEKGTADVRQQRFLKDAIKEKSDGGCWWVPLSYTNENEKAFDVTKPKSWLSCSNNYTTIENLPDENTWILFNVQVAGLYKINYDDHNWKLLSQTLNSPKHVNIPTLNKVQLLDDAFDLSWTGNLKYDVLFELLKYLKYEEDYLPWKAALTNVNTLNRQLRKSSIYGDFKTYMKHVLSTIYQKMGGLDLSESKSGKLDAVKHQVLIASWSCRFDVANCISDAEELFRKYQKNPSEKNIISKELRSVIYCTSIRHGSEKEWEFLWGQYKKSNVASEKNTILSSLGCTREIWLLRRFLEWSVTPNSAIRKQDSTTVFAAVAGNDVGYYVAKNFLYTKAKDIYKYLGQSSKRISRYLSSVATQTTNEDDYKELQNFVKDNQAYLKEVKQGVEQSLETAKLNVQWQHRHMNGVESLLRKSAEGSTV